MSNPFDQFGASTPGTAAPSGGGNPFDQFGGAPQSSAPAAPQQPQTSQGLGFYKGMMTAFDNASQGLRWLVNAGVLPGTLPGSADAVDKAGSMMGLPSLDQAKQGHQQYIADQEAKGIQPGGWGEFAGDVVGTAPLALTGMGPLAAGAASGALLSPTTDPKDVLTNMAIGAVGGKAVDLAVARWVGKQLPSAVGTPDEAAAASFVQRIAQNAGKTPQDITQFAADRAGKPVTTAEALGPSGISATAALARRQGQTGDLAKGLLGERAEGRPDRILGDYAQASGIDPNAAQGNIDGLVAQGRQSAKPLFDAALSTPGPVWNDNLRAFAQRPVVQKAIAGAMDDLRNADVHPGVLGLNPPDEGDLLPTAQAWDLIRKNVNSQVERDPFGKIIPDSQSRGNFNVNKAGRDLTAELRNAIPGYGDALDASGDYLSLQQAFNNGQKFVMSPSMTADTFAKQFAKLSPAEQEAFKGGTANAIFNRAQSGTLYPSVFKRPILQNKLATVLGNNNADQFLTNMQHEADMAAAGSRMAPGTNSITSEVMNATSEQDLAGAALAAARAATHAAHGNLLGTITHLGGALRDLGYFGKTGTMSVPVRDEAGKLLLMSPGDFTSRLQQLYAGGGPAAERRVTQFLAKAKAPLQIAAPAALIQAAPSYAGSAP